MDSETQTDEDHIEQKYSIQLAIVRKDMISLQKALNDGADPNALHGQFCCPVHDDIHFDYLELVKHFIEPGACISMPEKTNELIYYPICLAAYLGNFEAVKLLINAGAEVNINDEMKSPIYLAAISNRIDIVKYLIQNGAKDEDLLHTIASDGSVSSLEALLDMGYDINLPCAFTKSSPLSHAIGYNLKNAAFLISRGADLNYKNETDETPLMAAIQFRSIEGVKLLLKAGAQVNATTSCNNTALVYACWSKSNEIVKLLLENGAETEIRNLYTNATPLMQAADPDNLDLLETLLSYNAQVNAQDAHGWTCLHSCTLYSPLMSMDDLLLEEEDVGIEQFDKTARSCLDMLIKYNADVNAATTDNLTALSIAVANNLEDTTKNLILYGADVHLDKNILVNCKSVRDNDCLKWLIEAGLNPYKIETTPEIEKVLRYRLENPLSLKQLCRISYLNYLRKSYRYVVANLELPFGIKNYMMFKS